MGAVAVSSHLRRSAASAAQLSATRGHPSSSSSFDQCHPSTLYSAWNPYEIPRISRWRWRVPTGFPLLLAYMSQKSHPWYKKSMISHQTVGKSPHLSPRPRPRPPRDGAFLFKAAKFPGPPSPTGGPPTAGAAGAAGRIFVAVLLAVGMVALKQRTWTDYVVFMTFNHLTLVFKAQNRDIFTITWQEKIEGNELT